MDIHRYRAKPRHPPPFHTHQPSQRWHPALSAISPPLAPSHHAASTEHAHRQPPPCLTTTTAGKCPQPSPISSWQPIPRSEPLLTSASLLNTNTVVCRARRTRCSVQVEQVALCHSARERSHSQLSACSGTVLGWVCVYSATGCTAESSRVNPVHTGLLRGCRTPRETVGEAAQALSSHVCGCVISKLLSPRCQHAQLHQQNTRPILSMSPRAQRETLV
jgi:hypothetical protein